MASFSHRTTACLIALVILAAVAIVYAPVVHGHFVWTDVLDFQQMGWLRAGDAWKHYVFRGFNNWVDYFRPLVVGLYALQLHLFRGDAAPMHAFSLGMHLADTMLVGMLAWMCAGRKGYAPLQCCVWLAACMVMYGLHPILAESVSWIGCQFDLLVTLFILAGLWVDTLIVHRPARAAAVTACFFLAACAKESAAAFPLILVTFQWAMAKPETEQPLRRCLRELLQRNGITYVALLIAGIGYLAFRHWALGALVSGITDRAYSGIARFQSATFSYAQYWRMLFWPMNGMSPVHEYAATQFASLTSGSVLIDVGAIALILVCLWRAATRHSPLACIVLAMTAALLPVLHVLPAAFATSVYHEHYMMTSLAVICAMLPLCRFPAFGRYASASLLRATGMIIGTAWLIVSVLSIRWVIPRWNNNIALWQWALTVSPDSTTAIDSLLAAYVDANDPRADAIAQRVTAGHIECTTCQLNIAAIALRENDMPRAQAALDVVKNARETAIDRQILGRYLTLTGQLLAMQGKLDDSESVLRYAITVLPLNAQPSLSLAYTLALESRARDAWQSAQAGIALLPPQDRERISQTVKQAIADDLALAARRGRSGEAAH